MSDDSKKILRLGEWINQNMYQYRTIITTTKITDSVNFAANDYSTKSAKVTIEPVDVVKADDLIRMFKDYDKYIDSCFNV